MRPCHPAIPVLTLLILSAAAPAQDAVQPEEPPGTATIQWAEPAADARDPVFVASDPDPVLTPPTPDFGPIPGPVPPAPDPLNETALRERFNVPPDARIRAYGIVLEGADVQRRP